MATSTGGGYSVGTGSIDAPPLMDRRSSPGFPGTGGGVNIPYSSPSTSAYQPVEGYAPIGGYAPAPLHTSPLHTSPLIPLHNVPHSMARPVSVHHVGTIPGRPAFIEHGHHIEWETGEVNWQQPEYHRAVPEYMPEPVFEPMREPEPEPEPEPVFTPMVRHIVQRSTPPPPPPPNIQYVDKIVEVPVEVKKYVEVEVPVEVTKVVEVEKVVTKTVEQEVEVPVEIEKRVEVPVPYERVVHVEVPVERIVYRDVPVPVHSGEERIVVKEVQVPVEVVREVPVAVEHIVYKEVQVPIEVGVRQETRIGDTRNVVGTEIRRSTHMTTEHSRADISDLRSYVASGGSVELNGSGLASGFSQADPLSPQTSATQQTLTAAPSGGSISSVANNLGNMSVGSPTSAQPNPSSPPLDPLPGAP